jgi:predicted GIY-YIG superfamily endonuclease
MSERHDTPSVNPPIGGQQLYRLFDADGALLYIGISYSAIARYAQHKADKPWIGDVCTITIETHDVSRSEIEAMEATAIRCERPRYNVVHARGVVQSRTTAPRSVPLVSFGHHGMNQHIKWHRALRMLGELATELDEVERDGDSWYSAPLRAEFVDTVAAAARALVFGDSCPDCHELAYPMSLDYTSKTWALCGYVCVSCHVEWTCGWNVARAA